MIKNNSSKGRSKGPSQRQLRAGELIRHSLVEILRRDGLREPALSGVSVTISEVKTSPDLKLATIYCMPLGGVHAGIDEDEIIKALNSASPHIRTLLGKMIEMKYTPALTFRKDVSFSEAGRIDALLARPEVARDLEKNSPPDGLDEKDQT